MQIVQIKQENIDFGSSSCESPEFICGKIAGFLRFFRFFSPNLGIAHVAVRFCNVDDFGTARKLLRARVYVSQNPAAQLFFQRKLRKGLLIAGFRRALIAARRIFGSAVLLCQNSP